jgi:arginyl-tRNA synthetase
VITSDLRQALACAVARAGFDPGAEPGLRPTGVPGQYAASVALGLGPARGDTAPGGAARRLAAELGTLPWVATAAVTAPGFVTVSVTPAALAAVAGRTVAAGPGCVRGDALAGVTVPAPPAADPLAAAGWEQARAALAARLTARLAAAAGAAVTEPAPSERGVAQAARPGTDVAAAVAFAGPDAVTFMLARAIPGQPVRIDPRVIARQVPGNPAYAVRYAHARAASGVRWAASFPGETISSLEAGSGGWPRRARLLDALSWLPERVAAAARRGRPDEFVRYLEDLASVTVDGLSSLRPLGRETTAREGAAREAAVARAAADPGTVARGTGGAPRTDRLMLAQAARTGLAAGLGLLGVSAPDRL